MYTLLIVDDEPIIADGLFEVFQNLNTLELNVYKAYSGDEAIEILKKTRIDIVLTDIRIRNERTAVDGANPQAVAEVQGDFNGL